MGRDLTGEQFKCLQIAAEANDGCAARLAKIHFGAGSLPRDCTITDISDGGVKVVAEFLEVPPQFTIIFAPDYSRQCRLRWRIGCEFGAEFTD